MSDLHHAVSLLKEGKLIGLPTETVYGLAADALNSKAMASIFHLKGRPTFNPLIIHTHSLEALKEDIIITPTARLLAEHFWPGPLTLVLRRSPHCRIDPLASAGLPTLAVRIPRHPLALELLKLINRPLAAPSANLSNHLSPTTKDMVLKDFKDLYVLEGGPAVVGVESTIIGLEGDVPTLYRPGGIALEAIEAVIGTIAQPGKGIHAPGMQKKHYAPNHSLRLNAVSKNEGELLLGFGDTKNADLNLSPTGDLTEAASNLFYMLHLLDARPSKGIAVSPIPMIGLGLAMNDRLKRGAVRD